jgi:hypothetical protein
MKALEVVVAHYREDMTWLAQSDLAGNCRIYHKGGTGPDDRFPAEGQSELANVGRESHTYLTHIVNNYDRLADVTVFTQGGIADHVRRGDDPARYLRRLSEAARGSNGSTFSVLASAVGLRWWRFRSWKGARTAPAPYDFRQFCREYVGLDCDALSVLRWTPGAIVAATRTSIWRRPRESYRRLLQLVNTPGDHEVGHFLERLWFYVLDAAQLRLAPRNDAGNFFQTTAQLAAQLVTHLWSKLTAATVPPPPPPPPEHRR